MQPTVSPSVRRGQPRALAAALLLAVGCAGSGSSCGSSCGGAFKTTDAQGRPFKYTGDRNSNFAQVRISQAGFNFLNAGTLNDLLAGINSQGNLLNIPCFETPELNGCLGGFLDITKVRALIGDSNFDAACTAADGTPITMTFKEVTWSMDAANQLLKAKIIAHIKSGALYFRTKEAHSSLCSGTTPIQARVFIDDEPPCAVGQICPQSGTELDLDLKLSTAPDGRLELDATDASLNAILTKFNPASIQIDGFATGLNPLPPAQGKFIDNGCDSVPNGTYTTTSGNNLACSGLANILAGGCNTQDPNSLNGLWCQVFETARTYLLNYVKNQFKDRVVAVLRQQLDKQRCMQSTNLQGDKVACDATHACANDDDNNPTTCDLARGVCVAKNQTGTHCEPIPLAIAGQLDVTGLTDKVGFPADTKLNLFAGLGGKTAPPAIDNNGLQLSAMAGTQPGNASGVSVCVPPVTFPPADPNIPALNFDDAANKPAGLTGYEVGFSLASQMLNRGFYDGFNAGMLCIAVTNKTSSFVSTGLFKTFLPSLGLVTGGKDAPMAILLRPTTAPMIRVGKGTLKQNPDGTFTPEDALITLSLTKLNLDFYATVDERSVRLFTLQADVSVPLGLRTFPGAQADTLQPVLGDLGTVLTNISALNNEMLAEDPGVVKDLIGAAIRLAQPLLAGVLTPITLPQILGLDLQVRGLAGAVPLVPSDLSKGYHHLAIWAGVVVCGSGGVSCTRMPTKTEAAIVARDLPEDLDELRGPARRVPSATIEARAFAPKGGEVEYSYRVDGGFWSPWVRGPRITIRDEIFLFQGHHTIEVTSREGGDDRTQDLEPVALDLLVSVEPPKAELVQLADGTLRTKASSVASPLHGLKFRYRLEGEGWTEPGPAREFSAAERGGRGLSVEVADEAGRVVRSHFGISATDAEREAAQAFGCSTSPRTGAWGLWPLLLAVLFAARRRR